MKERITSNQLIRLTEQYLICLSLAISLSACSLIEPHRAIYGNWRAEQLAFAGIAIPIAPSMEFSSDQVILDGTPVAVQGYEKNDNKITVHLKDGTSLTFEMQGANSMSIELPFIGSLRYFRVK